jgi:hypothetical protein
MDLTTHFFHQVQEWTSHYNINEIMPESNVSTTLLDLQDKTAVVKVVAEWAPNRWGGDYVMLSKKNNDWFITAIFWQSII